MGSFDPRYYILFDERATDAKGLDEAAPLDMMGTYASQLTAIEDAQLKVNRHGYGGCLWSFVNGKTLRNGIFCSHITPEKSSANQTNQIGSDDDPFGILPQVRK